MVTVTSYQKRKNAETGEEFFTLDLESSSVELVRSKSGRMYATKRTCSIGCTFNEESCKALVGTTLNGEIHKTEVQPYEVIDKNTGEVRISEHRYEFYMEGEKPPVSETSLVAKEELVSA
jgi:hypothetical protein